MDVIQFLILIVLNIFNKIPLCVTSEFLTAFIAYNFFSFLDLAKQISPCAPLPNTQIGVKKFASTYNFCFTF